MPPAQRRDVLQQLIRDRLAACSQRRTRILQIHRVPRDDRRHHDY